MVDLWSSKSVAQSESLKPVMHIVGEETNDISGQVIVTYCKAPTMERKKVGFSTKVEPSALRRREEIFGVVL